MDLIVKEKVEAFFLQGKKVVLKKRKIFLSAAQEEYPIYYLHTGNVKQYFTSEEGNDITIHVFKPGSFFPSMLALSGQTNKYTFETITDVTMYQVSKEKVLAFLQAEPTVLFDLAKRLSMGINGLVTKMEHILFSSVHQKVTSLLVYLATHFGDPQNNTIKITLQLTHDDIASWVGSQRETVSRAMEKLKKDGIISYTANIITITSLAKLEKETHAR